MKGGNGTGKMDNIVEEEDSFRADFGI